MSTMRRRGATALIVVALATLTACGGSASGDDAATTRQTLTPVRADGAAAGGWTVHDGVATVTCSPAIASPDAVSAGVVRCFPTALAADTCWPAAAGGRVLCLTDPWLRSLVSYAITTTPARIPAVSHPVPIGLELSDGQHCRRRDGGAETGPDEHPDWTAYYLCAKGITVWGPSGGTGITQNASPWTVQAGTADAPLTDLTVARALYAGTGS